MRNYKNAGQRIVCTNVRCTCTILCAEESNANAGNCFYKCSEAECMAATSCAHDIMFAMRLLESMRLKVKKPVLLYMESKRGVNIFSSWNINEKRMAIAARFIFVTELKDGGIFEVD